LKTGLLFQGNLMEILEIPGNGNQLEIRQICWIFWNCCKTYLKYNIFELPV
jgi:hypothetical protein